LYRECLCRECGHAKRCTKQLLLLLHELLDCPLRAFLAFEVLPMQLSGLLLHSLQRKNVLLGHL